MGATYRMKSGGIAFDVDDERFLADYERGEASADTPLDYNGMKTTAGEYFRKLERTSPQAAANPPTTPPAVNATPPAFPGVDGMKKATSEYYRRVERTPPQTVPVPPPVKERTPREIEKATLEEARRIMKQKHGDKFKETETPSSIYWSWCYNGLATTASGAFACFLFYLSFKYGISGHDRCCCNYWEPNYCLLFPAVIVAAITYNFGGDSIEKGNQYKDFLRIMYETREKLINGGNVDPLRDKKSG